MIVIWHPEATLSAAQTAEYIRLRDGEVACAAFIDAIDAAVKTLHSFPESYPEEHFFRNNQLHFRSVSIQRLNKIVYRIDGEIVYIVDFWDTRMRPWTLITRVLNRVGK